MTGPALRALRETLPDVRLTLLASPGGAHAAPLLPWLDDVIAERVLWQDLGHLPFDPGREQALAARLRDGQFDAAIIFTSFSQSPHPPAFLCQLAGIPLRLGASKEQGGDVLTHEQPSPPDDLHQVERNLQLLEFAGLAINDRSLSLHITPDAVQDAEALLARHGLRPGAPFLLLSAFASCQARTFPTDRFAAAAYALAKGTGWPVLVTGREAERQRSQVIFQQLGERAVDLLGQTTVPQLAALVARARLALTNNSLVLHLADATRTPGLIMYSGTEYESQWQPRHSPHRLLRRPTPCSPCYAFTCPYNLECLDFTPQVVAAAGLQLLQQSVPT
jgi:ADP-heptose:LPS heptosyltransferase